MTNAIAAFAALAFGCMLPLAHEAAAQAVPGGYERRAWGGLGAGPGSKGLAGSLHIGVELGAATMVSMRAAGVADPDAVFASGDAVGDLAVGLGLYRFRGDQLLSVSLGAGLLTGVRRGADLPPPRRCPECPGGYQVIQYGAPGLALDLFLAQVPRRTVSFGMHVFGNLNREQPFAGLSLQIVSTTSR